MAILLSIIKPFIRLALKIVSVIIFLLTIAAAFGGRVNPNLWYFPSVLTLALPYLAVITALITLAWFVSGRWITAALGVGTLVLCWGPISTACPLHFSKKAEDPNRTFSVLTYNVYHGYDLEHPDDHYSGRTFRYILDSGADLIGVQEIKNFNDPLEVPWFRGELRDSLLKAYPYQAGGTASDLKVMSKYPVKLIKDYYTHALYEVKLPWGTLHWINMHMTSFSLSDEERKVMKEVVSGKDTEQGLNEMKGPVKSKLKAGFIRRVQNAEELRKLVESIPGALIVSGDFNDVTESYAYRLIRGDDLKDAYSETSFGPLITYNRYGFWFHIDQILYRPGPLKALSVKKGRLKSSDHYPLTAEFEWE